MKSRVRTAVVALALAASAAIPQAFAAPTAQVNSGYTLVEFLPEFVGALTSLQIAPSKNLPGTLYQRIGFFPITGGRLDAATARGEIPHSGGVKLHAGFDRGRADRFRHRHDGIAEADRPRHRQRVDRRPHSAVQPRAAGACAATGAAGRPRDPAHRRQQDDADRRSRHRPQWRVRHQCVRGRIQHRCRVDLRELLNDETAVLPRSPPMFARRTRCAAVVRDARCA